MRPGANKADRDCSSGAPPLRMRPSQPSCAARSRIAVMRASVAPPPDASSRYTSTTPLGTWLANSWTVCGGRATSGRGGMFSADTVMLGPHPAATTPTRSRQYARVMSWACHRGPAASIQLNTLGQGLEDVVDEVVGWDELVVIVGLAGRQRAQDALAPPEQVGRDRARPLGAHARGHH